MEIEDLKANCKHKFDKPANKPASLWAVCERTGGYCHIDSCPIFDAYRIAKRIGSD